MIVGIEGGGTKTTVLTSDGRRETFGPLNLKLVTDQQILDTFRRFNGSTLRRAAICLAGCRTELDRQRIWKLANRAWPKAENIFVGSDLDSGLAAAFGVNEPGILIISGTGSVVVGRNQRGEIARTGGWGHLLGDHGSGYWIAMTGLRAAIREFDRQGRFPDRILRRLCLNTPDQLVDWIQNAGKDEIAALAGEFMQPGLMLQAASFLAQDCHAVARKLGLTAPPVKLAGGVLINHRKFATLVSNRIRAMLPGAKVSILRRDTAEGALECAGLTAPFRSAGEERRQAAALQITEQRNPCTMDLDRRSISGLVDTMLSEESRVIPAIHKNKRVIERSIQAIVVAFKRGGRLFYVGAGTSGRLGVLDASECPPTFSTDPEMVQAIIAGGAPALQRAVEAAEDDAQAGAEAVRHRGVSCDDVVIGISASGRTPFVLGALDEAKRREAKTFLLCFSAPLSTLHAPLFFPTGPEILTGSTRLKAGTATKLVLNMLSTISMIRFGKVAGNLMVDVRPTNEKLRARASRIVATLRRCSENEARQRLVRSNWNVKQALR